MNMRKVYDKIVRDRIPEIIEKDGKRAETMIVSENEMKAGLMTKLVEEAREFAESGETEELADVMEVIYALLDLRGETMADVERIRINKKETRGGFEKRIKLISVEK